MLTNLKTNLQIQEKARISEKRRARRYKLAKPRQVQWNLALFDCFAVSSEFDLEENSTVDTMTKREATYAERAIRRNGTLR